MAPTPRLQTGPSDFAAPDPTALEALRVEHQMLEQRLAELDRHVALTAAEQIERAELKKRKLATKDRIARLTRAATNG